MSVQEIEEAIANLSPKDLKELVRWFADFQYRKWDQELERDLEAGRLDRFISEAEAEYMKGKVRPL